MPVLRLFAAAREAAGVARVDIEGSTVAEMLEAARLRYGDQFVAVLSRSRVWVNGQPAEDTTPVAGRDVVAVIPPVSGGADDSAGTNAALLDRPRSHGGSGPTERETQGPSGPTEREEPRPYPVPDRPTRSAPPDPRWPGPERPYRAGEPGPERRPRAPDPDATRGNGEGATYRAGAALVDAGRQARDPGLRLPSAPSRPEPVPQGPTGPSGLADRVPEASRPGAVPRTQEPAASPRTVVEGARTTARKLAVVFTVTRPHGRLGLVWGLLLVGATIAGAEYLAGLLGLTAFVGACQTLSARRAKGERPVPALAAATALAMPLAAVWGVRPALMATGVAIALTLGLCVLVTSRRTGRDIWLTLATGGALGLAAAALVLLRDAHLDVTLLLVAYAAAYDAGAYLVGTGASNAWEGPAAGVVALIPVAILSAVVLVPPLPAGGPLLLALLAGMLTPLGPLAGTALVGSADADVPGLRRLDSLLLLAPLWGACAAALV